jgi:hypothetical protein
MKNYHLRPRPEDDPLPFGAETEAEVTARENAVAGNPTMRDDMVKALHNAQDRTPEDELQELVDLEKTPTTLTEELLFKYRTLALEVKAKEAAKENLRKLILRLTGPEPQAVTQVGKAVLKLTPRKGASKIDWEKWGRKIVGDAAVDSLLAVRDQVKAGRMESDYVKKEKDGVTVEVDELA